MPRKSKTTKKRVRKTAKRRPVRRNVRRQQGNGIVSDFVNDHPILTSAIGAAALGALGAGAYSYAKSPSTYDIPGGRARTFSGNPRDFHVMSPAEVNATMRAGFRPSHTFQPHHANLFMI